MVDIIDPVTKSIGSLMNMVQLLVGGVFGLYLIIFVWKVYDARKQKKMLKNIQSQLRSLKAAVKRIEESDRKLYVKKLNELIKKVK